MSVLDTVLEQRDVADKAYREFGDTISAPDHAPTEIDEAKLNELRAERDKFDTRVLELNAEATRSAEIEEVRKRLGTTAAVQAVSEPRTYGPDSPNSYFADFVRSSNPQWPGYDEARQRQAKYSSEVAGEMRDSNSAEGKRAMRSVREHYRQNNASVASEAVSRAKAFTYEARAGMDTTSGSGGSFVTPQYFVGQYAPYRQFNRVFADAANKHQLPAYGMTIFVPQVTGPAGVAAQANQNSGITETDPTAGYLSASLTTNAGQVTVSQQLLDRAGPDFAFDVMVFDQLGRDYDLVFDQFVLTQALLNAGSVSMSSTAVYGAGSLYSKVAQAKAATVDAAGVVMPATHLFMPPVNFEWYQAQVDTTGRPLFVPDYAGAFNAIASGSDGTPIADGATGYKVQGLPVFEDGNIPLSSTNNQIVVAHMPEVWYWEGDLVTRTIPQTYAPDLSVLLQVYSYGAVIVRYPKAVQTVTGAGVPASPTF